MRDLGKSNQRMQSSQYSESSTTTAVYLYSRDEIVDSDRNIGRKGLTYCEIRQQLQ